MKNILCVFGTRPEAIKMAPLIKELQESQHLKPIVCVTGQHQQMLQQVLEFFDIKPYINLEVMKGHPKLAQIYSIVLERLQHVIEENSIDGLLVHGDTATTAAGAMAAFLNKIPLGHIEAGLRTHNMHSPWPEEFNRRLTSLATTWHFAPTQQAKNNLLAEAVPAESILVTGNTVIDSLFLTLKKLHNTTNYEHLFYQRFPMLRTQKKLILVTGHRRENIGQGIHSLCLALKALAARGDVEIVFPVHLNPHVLKPVQKMLDSENNIHLVKPMNYNDFVFLMQQSYLVITDSGGIQEEAPSLGKPVLVTRDTTERPEAVEAGTVSLVGNHHQEIISQVSRLLDDYKQYIAISQIRNPYGTGDSSELIVRYLEQQFTIDEANQSIPLSEAIRH